MNSSTNLPADIHVTLLNNWHIPREYRAYLQHHYLLHWELEYLLRRIGERPDKRVEHNGTIYQPVYKSPFTLDTNSQVMLSFRSPEKIIDYIPNYVLIKSAS